jgi:hypothetical protein
MMISPVRLAWLLIAIALCNSAAATPPLSSPPATVLITQAVDTAQTTELAGNTRPEARNPGNDHGIVPDDFPLPDLLLQLRRPADREIALAALIDAQTDPASPYYHQWLGAGEFGTLFGPAQPDIDTIVAWLQAQGFVVSRVYESGMTIAFSGTAGTVRRAFATEIHALEVDGGPHYANVSNPRIPSALAPAVHGVVALHDFPPQPNSRPRIAPEYSISGVLRAVVPADLAAIYDLNPLFSANNKGSGITIALIENTDIYSLSDINTFRTVFGLGTSTFNQVHPGCTDPGAVIGNDSEATLDVEWAAAAAPAATLELVSCANLFDALANLVNANATPPSIMSISYGACEAALGASANAFVSSTYQQAVAKGISVFVSSGDEGAAGCFSSDTTQANFGIGVNGLASTPYNVAVGGTDFGDTFAGTTNTYWNTSNTATYGSAKSYINEIPWNDSCASKLIASFEGFATTYGSSGFCNSAAGASFLTTAAGSGGPSGCSTGAPSTANVVGGSCAGTAKPSWQSGFLGNPNDHVRDLPDVSLFAANGVWDHYYVYCFSDPRPDPNNNNVVYGKACTGAPSGWAGAGGTSFSAPILAAFQALVNQKNAIAYAGNPNPTYYKLAAAEYGASGSASCNSSNGAGVGSTCVFYDVTQGDIDVNCAAGTPNCYRPSGTHGVLSTSTASYLPAYGTTTGWDFATGLGSINAANLVANWPVATKLKFTTQPVSGVAGSTLAAIKVSVENVSGNAVVGDTSAVTIKFGSNPGSATLGGTLTMNAVNGVATFSNITINKTGTGYTLVASDGSLTTDTSGAFNITPAAAAKLVFTAQPPSTAASGTGFGAKVTIQDAFGNVATGNTSTVALALTSANGATLSGTKSVNAVNAVATFSGLSIDKAGSYTLTATDGVLTSAISTSIAISHGAATKLAFTTQPPASIASAVGFGVAVTVQDAAGNTVTGNSSIVSLALTNPAGATLSGSAAIAASNGVATFNGLSLDKAGSYTLTATDGSLTAAISNAFTVTAGAATKLVFTTQPVDITAGSTMNVAVAIEDAAGNVEASDNTTRINLGSSACSNATMVSAVMAGGTAQFANLRFYSVGSGRQLQASSPSLSAGSATFNVSANADLIFADAFSGCLP